jgi:choline dehydrogenase-like flavoprotein
MSAESELQAFDYVIIGGGTAGLVVAARLTEVEDVSVCVLEAGEDVTHTDEASIPGLVNPSHSIIPTSTGLIDLRGRLCN